MKGTVMDARNLAFAAAKLCQAAVNMPPDVAFTACEASPESWLSVLASVAQGMPADLGIQHLCQFAPASTLEPFARCKGCPVHEEFAD